IVDHLCQGSTASAEHHHPEHGVSEGRGSRRGPTEGALSCGRNADRRPARPRAREAGQKHEVRPWGCPGPRPTRGDDPRGRIGRRSRAPPRELTLRAEGGSMRVGRVEAFAVRYPEPNNDGKIRALTLVRVETDNGAVGGREG